MRGNLPVVADSGRSGRGDFLLLADIPAPPKVTG